MSTVGTSPDYYVTIWRAASRARPESEQTMFFSLPRFTRIVLCIPCNQCKAATVAGRGGTWEREGSCEPRYFWVVLS